MGPRLEDGRHCSRRYILILVFLGVAGLLDLVGKMAKGEQWNDVRLLSFDLQTVEFAYAQVSGHLSATLIY